MPHFRFRCRHFEVFGRLWRCYPENEKFREIVFLYKWIYFLINKNSVKLIPNQKQSKVGKTIKTFFWKIFREVAVARTVILVPSFSRNFMLLVMRGNFCIYEMLQKFREINIFTAAIRLQVWVERKKVVKLKTEIFCYWIDGKKNWASIHQVIWRKNGKKN